MNSKQRRRFHLQVSAMVINIAESAVLAYGSPLYDQTPYHTSALSGAAWVNKLMTGHPEHICCELGGYTYMFSSSLWHTFRS